jgi:hypothetical protein
MFLTNDPQDWRQYMPTVDSFIEEIEYGVVSDPSWLPQYCLGFVLVEHFGGR